jgi:peptide deformylase
MVKQIVKDPFFLQQKSEPATEADKQVIQDLTLVMLVGRK